MCRWEIGIALATNTLEQYNPAGPSHSQRKPVAGFLQTSTREQKAARAQDSCSGLTQGARRQRR